MQRLHLFRAGTHTPGSGSAIAFSEADLSAMATAYDPALHEAPIVVGHPKSDGPAYGWIGALQSEGGDVFGEPRDVDDAFAELVQKGRFKKLSIALYSPDAPNNPKPGGWYLRHVGFLGAQPPAVKGLKPVQFAAGDEGIVTVEFAEGWRTAWLFQDVATLFRGVRDWIVGSAGAEKAEQILPGGAVQRIAEEAARMQEREAAASSTSFGPSYAEPPGPASTTSTEETVTEDLAARERGLDERERAVAEREAAARSREAQAAHAQNVAFVEGLVRDARLPQGLAPRAVAVLGALTAEVEVTFAEGDGEVKQGAVAAFRDLLAKLPKAVEFGERAGGADLALNDPGAISDAAKAHQAEQERLGKSIGFAEAVEHVTRKGSAAQ